MWEAPHHNPPLVSNPCTMGPLHSFLKFLLPVPGLWLFHGRRPGWPGLAGGSWGSSPSPDKRALRAGGGGEALPRRWHRKLRHTHFCSVGRGGRFAGARVPLSASVRTSGQPQERLLWPPGAEWRPHGIFIAAPTTSAQLLPTPPDPGDNRSPCSLPLLTVSPPSPCPPQHLK